MRGSGSAVVALAGFLAACTPSRRVVQLPSGITEVRSEIDVDSGTELRGKAGTVLLAAPGFNGRAIIVVHGDNAYLHDFSIDGNRDVLEVRSGLPRSDVPFAHFTRGNGVLAEAASNLIIKNIQFRNVAGFAVLASRAQSATIDYVEIVDSGSRNAAGRNNATGGILLEEGAADFRITHCRLRNIRGNGIWTHSLYTSRRNGPGQIAFNFIDTIGRDAIQVGHATEVRVEDNYGSRIGFPVEAVDMENRAVPVAIDTAGNVDRSAYLRNRFTDLDGKCIDLDGFHDGEVRGNICENRRPPEDYPYGGDGIVMNNSNPDMQSQNIRVEDNQIYGPRFGGIFVIGTGHRIANNRLLNLNTAHCNEEAARFGCYYAQDEPDMLRSGIYLGRGADRPAPARGNTIENNQITGYKMDARCVALAPGIQPSWNTIRGNTCRAE